MASNPVDTISDEEILLLHALSIQEFGGDPTQRETDGDCIRGVIRSAINSAGYMKQGDVIDPIHLASCL